MKQFNFKALEECLVLFEPKIKLCRASYIVQILLFLLVVGTITLSCKEELINYDKISKANDEIIIKGRDFGPSVIPTLCVGCGCSQIYQSCLGGNENHGCWVSEVGIDRDCCKEMRKECHECDNGIICIRFSFMGNPNPGFYSINYPFDNYQDSLLLLPYWTQIDKFLKQQPLSEEDFEILDTDLIEE